MPQKPGPLLWDRFQKGRRFLAQRLIGRLVDDESEPEDRTAHTETFATSTSRRTGGPSSPP